MTPAMTRARRRADVVLLERGFFNSRAKAQEAIAAGCVAAGGGVLRKPSDLIEPDCEIIAAPAYEWVSRGGVKLAAALDFFGLDPEDKLCLDVGASTGGFSQVLLARGARRVYAIDVGVGQLHDEVKKDARIVSYEKCDARDIRAEMMDAAPEFLVCDVSFISLRRALPRALALAAPEAELVVLIKPQFEAGPAHIRKGLVKDPEVHARVCRQAGDFLESAGWRTLGLIASPIAGGSGNREFLTAAKKRPC